MAAAVPVVAPTSGAMPVATMEALRIVVGVNQLPAMQRTLLEDYERTRQELADERVAHRQALVDERQRGLAWAAVATNTAVTLDRRLNRTAMANTARNAVAIAERLQAEVQRLQAEVQRLTDVNRGANERQLGHVDPPVEADVDGGDDDDDDADDDEGGEGMDCVLCHLPRSGDRRLFNMQPVGRWAGLAPGARIICSTCYHDRRDEMGLIESINHD